MDIQLRTHKGHDLVDVLYNWLHSLYTYMVGTPIQRFGAYCLMLLLQLDERVSLFFAGKRSRH